MAPPRWWLYSFTGLTHSPLSFSNFFNPPPPKKIWWGGGKVPVRLDR